MLLVIAIDKIQKSSDKTTMVKHNAFRSENNNISKGRTLRQLIELWTFSVDFQLLTGCVHVYIRLFIEINVLDTRFLTLPADWVWFERYEISIRKSNHLWCEVSVINTVKKSRHLHFSKLNGHSEHLCNELSLCVCYH